MPIYRTNYQGSRIVLSHNIRNGTYTLLISNPDEARKLSFRSNSPRDVSDIQASDGDYRYFKGKKSTIRAAFLQLSLSENERLAVISLLDRL